MDRICNEKGSVISNESVGSDLYLMTVALPYISNKVLPGQFIHMLIPGMEGHILRRPFSIYACSQSCATVDILYQVVGFGTERLSQIKLHEEVEAIGPIGTPWFPPETTKRALLIGGGVGSAPLFMLAGVLLKKGAAIDVVLGASTKETLVCHNRYNVLINQAATDTAFLHCATDDGSFGHGGFCTDLVEEVLSRDHTYDYAAICGPEPMAKRAVSMVLEAGIHTEVSLERRMACGIGACLSCVVETIDGYKRACVDGPVFNANEVVFS